MPLRHRYASALKRSRHLAETAQVHVRNSGAEIRRLHDRIAVLQRRDAERACYVDTLREDHVQEVVMFERMIRARDAELDQQRRHISELQAQCRRLQESLAACVDSDTPTGAVGLGESREAGGGERQACRGALTRLQEARGKLQDAVKGLSWEELQMTRSADGLSAAVSAFVSEMLAHRCKPPA